MTLALWLSECSHSRGGTGAGPSEDHRHRPSLGLVHILCELHGRATELLPGCKSRTLTFIKLRELLNPNAVSESNTNEAVGKGLISYKLSGRVGVGEPTAQREQGYACSFLSDQMQTEHFSKFNYHL